MVDRVSILTRIAPDGLKVSPRLAESLKQLRIQSFGYPVTVELLGEGYYAGTYVTFARYLGEVIAFLSADPYSKDEKELFGGLPSFGDGAHVSRGIQGKAAVWRGKLYPEWIVGLFRPGGTVTAPIHLGKVLKSTVKGPFKAKLTGIATMEANWGRDNAVPDCREYVTRIWSPVGPAAGTGTIFTQQTASDAPLEIGCLGHFVGNGETVRFINPDEFLKKITEAFRFTNEPSPNGVKIGSLRQYEKKVIPFKPGDVIDTAASEILLPGFIRAGELAVISGGPKVGKTLMTKEMVIAGALGEECVFGRFTRPIRSLYFSLEGQEDDVAPGFAAICYERGWDATKLMESLSIIALDGKRPGILNVAAGIIDYLHESPEPFDLIAIDNFKALLPTGVDDSHAPTVKAVFSSLMELRNAVAPAAILLIMHQPKETKDITDGVSCVYGPVDIGAMVETGIGIGRVTPRRLKRNGKATVAEDMTDAPPLDLVVTARNLPPLKRRLIKRTARTWQMESRGSGGANGGQANNPVIGVQPEQAGNAKLQPILDDVKRLLLEHSVDGITRTDILAAVKKRQGIVREAIDWLVIHGEALLDDGRYFPRQSA